MDEEKFNKICENVKDTRYSVERTEGMISDFKRGGREKISMPKNVRKTIKFCIDTKESIASTEFNNQT